MFHCTAGSYFTDLRGWREIYYTYIGTIKPACSPTTGVRQDNSATLLLSYLSDDTLKKETNRPMNHKMILTAADDEIHDSGY